MIVLWGTTAFGVVHVYIEYVIMIGFRFSDVEPSARLWVPDFATITISAILTVIMTLRTPKRAGDAEPQVDPRAGSLTSPEPPSVFPAA